MTTTQAYSGVKDYLGMEAPSLRTMQRWAARELLNKTGRDYEWRNSDVQRFLSSLSSESGRPRGDQ